MGFNATLMSQVHVVAGSHSGGGKLSCQWKPQTCGEYLFSSPTYNISAYIASQPIVKMFKLAQLNEGL